MSLGVSDPREALIQKGAQTILAPLDLSDDEINAIIEEWCSYDFEVGQAARCLAKLQRIAFEHLQKREENWGEYRQQFSRRPLHDGFAILAED